jgi:hypothetical protein
MTAAMLATSHVDAMRIKMDVTGQRYLAGVDESAPWSKFAHRNFICTGNGRRDIRNALIG